MGDIINSYFIDKKTLLKEIKLLAQWKSLGNSDSKTSPPPAFCKIAEKKKLLPKIVEIALDLAGPGATCLEVFIPS